MTATTNKMLAGGFVLVRSDAQTQEWARGKYTARLHFAGGKLTGVYRTYPDQDSVAYPSVRAIVRAANNYPAGC